MDGGVSRDLVLRALVAAEIAESCTHAELRRSFFALSELWLARAEAARDLAGGVGDDPSPAAPARG